MTVYVVVNGGDTKVYTNKEAAEAEAKRVNYHLDMGGSYTRVRVVATELR